MQAPAPALDWKVPHVQLESRHERVEFGISKNPEIFANMIIFSTKIPGF